MNNKPGQLIKLMRVTTIPLSLAVLLRHQLRFMSAHFEVIAVSSPGEALREVAIQEGVRTAAVPMKRAISPLADLVALYKLYRLFKKERPGIVHTHTPKAGMLGMMAAGLAGVPVRLHTVAGLPLMEKQGWKRKLLELTERVTCYCATAVLPNSKKLAAFILEKRYCPPQKLKVLGNGSSNGIDMEYFAPSPQLAAAGAEIRRQWNLDESNFIFTFIGRLVKDKGIEELVNAFTTLYNTYDHLKLLLVGGYELDLDPVSERIRRVIQSHAGIVHTGFQQDVRPYLAISQALVFPSYREGFPNAPLQAGCFNLPAIVSDINGCNEIIEPYKNGLIVPPKKSGLLRQAMETMLTNKPLYLAMKANSREMIRQRYEQKHFWNLLLEEYRRQLKSPSYVPEVLQTGI